MIKNYATKPYPEDPLLQKKAEAAIKYQTFIKQDFVDLNPVLYGEATISYDNLDVTYLRTICYHNIFYVLEGMCILSFNGKEMPVKKGDCFMIPLGSNAKLVCRESQTMTHRWIGFTGTLAADFINFPRVFPLPSQIAQMLPETVHSTRNLASRLACVLFLIHSHMNRPTAAKLNYTQQIVNYIHASYMKKISIVEISNMLNLERHYMSKLFKAEMNMSIQDYILQYRIIRAQRYLKHNYTVTDSARLCGFCDRANFTKAFTRAIGCSPAQWVKLLSQNSFNKPE